METVKSAIGSTISSPFFTSGMLSLAEEPWKSFFICPEPRNIVKTSDLNDGDTVSFQTESGIWHCGIIRILNEQCYLCHNHPGVNACMELLSGYVNQKTVLVLLGWKEEHLKEGKEARMDTGSYNNKYGPYKELSNNCQHYVVYVMTNNHVSPSVDMITPKKYQSSFIGCDKRNSTNQQKRHH